MASQYTTFVIQFATSVIVSRLYLLPADVGLFSIALAAALLISIFQDMGISRFVTGQPEMRHEHVREYAAVAVAAGLLVAGIVAGISGPAAAFYGQPGLRLLLVIIATSFAVSALAIVPVALLLRAMDFRGLFMVNAGSALAGGAASIALAAQGAGPASLAWGVLAAGAVRVVTAMALRPVVPRLPQHLAAIRPLLGFGSASFLISFSGALGMRSQDLIVGRMLGIAETGLFTRAGALAAQLSTLLVGAINGVFNPAFARKRDLGEDLAGPYLHLVACNTAITWAAAVGLALAAEPVVVLLYGPAWIDVAPLLRWTAIAEIFFLAIPLQMDIPILLGRIRTLIWINLLDTAATITILAVFCLWGVEAAAISRLVAGMLWFAIYIPFIRSLLKLRVGALLGVYGKSAACALAGGAPMLAGLFFSPLGRDPGILTLIGLAGCGVIAWLCALKVVNHPAWREVRLVLDRLPQPGRLQSRA